jgi:hypothetical protein
LRLWALRPQLKRDPLGSDTGTMAATDSFGKAQRKELRRLASLAYERELGAALAALETHFREWHAGSCDVHQLSDMIHQFHNGIARDLFVTYTRLEPRLAVAQAVARKVLRDDEVPATLREALHTLIAFYEESEV